MLNRFRLFFMLGCGVAAIGLAPAAAAPRPPRRAAAGAAAAADAAAAATRRSSRRRCRRATCRSTSPPSATSRRTRPSRVRSQVTGQLAGSRLPRRRLRQDGRSCSSRSIARPFEAALAQAEANLTRDQALLGAGRGAARARRGERRVSAGHRRAPEPARSQRGILSKDAVAAVAQSQADATAALVKADKATIESAKAQLVAQQAAVDNAQRAARLHASIKSPIDGRTGNLTVKVGNLVTANQHRADDDRAGRSRSTSPSRCRRCTCRRSSSTWRERQARRSPRRRRTPSAQPATGTLTLHRQRRRHDDRHDQAEGDVRQRRPSRCGPASSRASACGSRRCTNATVVPSQAVQTGQDGQFVFVVKPDSTVEQRPVDDRRSASAGRGRRRRGLKPARRSSPKASCGSSRARTSRRDPNGARRRRTDAAAAAAARQGAGRQGAGRSGRAGQ